jgi:hypothetical protein
VAFRCAKIQIQPHVLIATIVSVTQQLELTILTVLPEWYLSIFAAFLTP